MEMGVRVPGRNLGNLAVGEGKGSASTVDSDRDPAETRRWEARHHTQEGLGWQYMT